MKSFTTLALLASSTYAAGEVTAAGEEFVAIEKFQVNNRTLLNKWELYMEYSIDAEEGRSPEENFIEITTIMRNEQVVEDYKRKIRNGEVFQTYFSMKDPERSTSMELDIPAPTAELEIETQTITAPVPFYENFVCSIVFNEENKNVEPYPGEVFSKQSCGLLPVYKWNSGLFSDVGDYGSAATCAGSDWSIVPEHTMIKEGDDGQFVEARCTFKRSFAAGGMREITYNEKIDWMAGYNIYNKKESNFRYVYGYSYESDLRNADVAIKADSMSLLTSLALSASVVATTLLF